MVFLCISDFRRFHIFSIKLISGLLSGHGGVSMPYASRNAMTKPHLWQEAPSCMKMRSPVPEKPRWPTHSAEESDAFSILFSTSYGLERCANGQYHDTPHHDLHVIFTCWTTQSSRRLTPDMRWTYCTCWSLHWMMLSSLNTTFTVYVHMVVNPLMCLAENPT